MTLDEAFATSGKILAVKITTSVLSDDGHDPDIWIALDENFEADDGCAVFHASEILLMSDKTKEQLRKIYETKVVFGSKSKVKGKRDGDRKG